MRAESDGLTIPMVVSTTTATATNTAPIVNPIHQSKRGERERAGAAASRGATERLSATARGASGISSQVDGVTAQRITQKRV